MNSNAFIENLKQLFAECDTGNTGSLGRKEFNELCDKIGLNKEAAEETFQRLDIDKNGRITFDEFTAGFNQYKETSSGSAAASPSAAKSAVGKSPTQTRVSRPTTNSTPSSQLKSNLPHASGSKVKSAASINATAPTSPKGSPQQPPPRFKPSEPARPASAMSSIAVSNRRKLSASPVSNFVARKNASPLGVLSLGSTGSSSTTSNNNLQIAGPNHARSSSAGAEVIDYSGIDESSTGADFNHSSLNNCNDTKINYDPQSSSNVVVYSSEHIGSSGLDYDQSIGSGQFGSLLSSNGSFSQVKNMQDLLESVQKLQSENQILTQIFFKDKREREEYISQLGEEFDQQVREVEERANRRAREELESEKKRLREMMQTERETLQHHYQTIEKMSHLIKSSNSGKSDHEIDGTIDKVKSKLEDTYLENRQLKKSLLDTKTDVAMIWKEMERLKRQYEDKLTNAYQRNNETRSECDHIKQQLTLMKDSNRKLQDASDVITNYITDKVDPVINGAVGSDELDGNGMLLDPTAGGSGSYRLGAGSQANSRRGSILSQYLNNGNSSTNNMGDQISNAGSSNHSADLESSLGSCGRWTAGNRVAPGDEADGSENMSGTSGASTATSGIGRLKKNNNKPHTLAKIEVSLTSPDDDDVKNSSSTSKILQDDTTTTTSPLKKSSSFTNNGDNSNLSNNFTKKIPQLHLQLQQQQQKLQEQSLTNLNKNMGGQKLATSCSSIYNDHSKQSFPSNSMSKSLYVKRAENDDQANNLSTTRHLNLHKPAPNHSVSLVELSRASGNNKSESSGKSLLRSKFGKRSLIGRHFFIGSRDSTQSESAGPISEAESKTQSNSNSLSLDCSVDNPAVEPADGPSKSTFDIILVGDSFVGKSSFAARFMEGSFVQGLISNCSIDFKTKAYKVDGINYTVNLWDTAGQERFRSITASYFRKANGIILMYDVTDKRSYLNVRNWMSTISDTASENVAVLLVGNKIDLRTKENKENCIPTKEGARLAREYGIMFLETSVKTGINLVPSMGKLIRLIAKNNMPAEEDKDRIKLSKKSKAFSCMC